MISFTLCRCVLWKCCCLSLFLLGGVPGLASCQPSGEPNDSFDPIRISAKSTLCSLRGCTRQLATHPPSMWLCSRPSVPTIHALWVPDSPVITGWTRQHGGKHFAESVLIQQTLNYTICLLSLCVLCRKCEASKLITIKPFSCSPFLSVCSIFLISPFLLLSPYNRNVFLAVQTSPIPSFSQHSPSLVMCICPKYSGEFKWTAS